MKIFIIRSNASVVVDYIISNMHMRSKVQLKSIKVIYKFNNRHYVLIINWSEKNVLKIVNIIIELCNGLECISYTVFNY